MGNAAATTTRRTFTISHLLLSFVVAFLLGAMLVPDVDADKNNGRKETSIAERVKDEKTRCEKNGGKIHANNQVGYVITTCTGGKHDGRQCTHTKKSTVCAPARTQPQSPLNDVTAPPTGGYEDPTGGGANPGGGGGIAPGWEADPDPSDDGGVVLASYGGQHDNAKHDGKRKHHCRGNRSH